MGQFTRIPFLGQALLLGLGLLASAASMADLDLAIDELTELSYQAPNSKVAGQLAPLLERLDEASPSQQARIRYLQVRLLGLQGQYQQGLELADQALSNSVPPEQALPLTRLAANVAVNAERQELAFEYLRQALLLLETHDEPLEHAVILGLSSQLQIEAGNGEQAVAHALAGLKQAERIDNPRIHCTAAARAAAALIADQAADRALAITIPAIPGCRLTGEAALIGSILNEAANAYLELGQTAPVGPLLDEAEALLTGHYHQGALLSRLLALRLLLAEDRPEAALELSRLLSAEFERLGLWRQLNDTLEVEAQAYFQLNDTASSYQARQRQLMARQRYLDRERLLTLAYAEVDFEARRGQQQLTLLHEQARINNLRNQARRVQLRLRLMITGLAVTTIILLGLLLGHSLTERRHFRRLAHHDGLTDLPNHSSFFANLDQQICRAGHNRQALSLVLADIDHFKAINDQYGHHLGDRVLKATARELHAAFSQHGFTGRIGGEEFAVCLPGVYAARARALTEVMQASLDRVCRDEVPSRITLSFGIAELKPGETSEQLRARADQALYAAKDRGRNQVVLA